MCWDVNLRHPQEKLPGKNEREISELSAGIMENEK